MRIKTMWDDIVIGEGAKIATAIKIEGLGGPPNISENKVSYWISECFLDIGMTIYKDTKEGEELTELISRKMVKEIKKFLDIIVLSKAGTELLRLRIIESNERYFEEGKKVKQVELLKVLGIDDAYL